LPYTTVCAKLFTSIKLG